jgi:hypothetical protein
MRTAEQLVNLKKVFYRVYGPIVLFMTLEEINKMGDLIQQEAVRSSQWTWKIKVRTIEDSSKKWDQIEMEPKEVRCTLRTISSKVEKLFPKHPKIASVLITAKEDEDLSFEFKSNVPS